MNKQTIKELLKTEEGQLLTLEIGPNVKPLAHTVPGLEESKVVTLDVDEKLKPDIVCDASNMHGWMKGKFDVVFASHVLEHFSYWDTEKVLKGWVECLKPGGTLYILVPSLEWAAREVLSENPSPAVYAQLYAGQVTQWDVHYTGFTMRKLRQLMDRIGINVHTARTGIYHITVGNLGDFEALQHLIIGKKDG